jgi:hypothetical protein
MTSCNMAALADSLKGHVADVFRIGYPEVRNLE